MLALVALLLAGCVAPGESAVPAAEAAPPAPAVPVTLERCTILEAITFVEPALVRPHVPEAFDLTLYGGSASVVLGGLSCGDGKAAERGFFGVQVEPRDPAHRAGGDANHFWMPEHYLAAGSPLTHAFVAAGATFETASLTAISVETSQARLRIEMRAGTHDVRSTGPLIVSGDAVSNLPPFREFTPAEGGFAYLDAAFGGDLASAGVATLATVETAPGTIARELLGASTTTSAIAYENIAYRGAVVGFVADGE